MGSSSATGSGGSTRKSGRFNEAKFINYELNAEERDACKSWLSDLTELDSLIHRACEEGYRFSLKWDARSKAYACFVQTDASSTGNAGYILTGRGSSPFKALKQALYKHCVLMDKEWGGYAEAVDWSAIDD